MRNEQLIKVHEYSIAIKQMAMQVEPLTTDQQQKIFEYAEQIEHTLEKIINPEKNLNHDSNRRKSYGG
ncbi:MAG: hypothetical protein A3F72_11880 [Bacteroidetes bacterium RIFCSPLOWO2_12_FULL_35_15]|nr:MAG: hypothetical protein A3F72_11880 [Bacteroidetes bacterium RIFCSPLOWO2_12_FULL_35_15]